MASLSDIRKVQKLLTAFRNRVDDTMSVQKLQVLLAAAAEPGIEQSSIMERAELSRAAVSKNVANLSNLTSAKEPGPDLVKSEMDPMNLVIRLIKLTPKGEKVVDECFSDAFGR